MKSLALFVLVLTALYVQDARGWEEGDRAPTLKGL